MNIRGEKKHQNLVFPGVRFKETCFGKVGIPFGNLQKNQQKIIGYTLNFTTFACPVVCAFLVHKLFSIGQAGRSFVYNHQFNRLF